MTRDPKLMSALEASVLPNCIDWKKFRTYELERTLEYQELRLRGPDESDEQHWPYFLQMMFEYPGGIPVVHSIVCDFFYSGDRAGKYYLGRKRLVCHEIHTPVNRRGKS